MKKNHIFSAAIFMAMSLTFLSSCASSKPKHVECMEYNNETHFCDNRDGKTYKYGKIGEQTWMLENLNYVQSGFSLDSPKCYAENNANCRKYGMLYSWHKAKSICPQGWHLPSDDEWQTLVLFADPNFVSDTINVAGEKLKAASDWTDGTVGVSFSGNDAANAGAALMALHSGAGTPILVGIGTDDFGFAALPGGGIVSGENGGFAFNHIGRMGSWWTSTEGQFLSAYRRSMGYGGTDVYKRNDPKGLSYSVRCVKD